MKSIERYGMAAVMGYEVIALCVKDESKIPTITAMQRKHKTLGVALVAYLATHFYQANKS